jgi:hypothetical protein
MYVVSFTELDTRTSITSVTDPVGATDTLGVTNTLAANDPSAANWHRARCRDGNGTLTHLFFSDEPIATARARAICSKCPLSAACLEGALERAEPWGVWGGQLIETGRIVADKRPRGRPPKHPRPLVVIDEDAIEVAVRVA